MKPKQLRYPWLGVMCLLVSLGLWLWPHAAQLLPGGIIMPRIAEQLLWLISLLALVAVIWDIFYFQYRQKKFIAHSIKLAKHCEKLIQEKKLLQQKAHTFANQTDKLKAFIGDRLLEYIEYDEKFLHFKGIAAEVRHNGIISYDIILQSLTRAREQNPDELSFQEAISALGYLWDLLDLSTADNMALHINNHLCECENYYYQQQLEVQPPYSPTFYAHKALLRALNPLTHTNERLHWQNDEKKLLCQYTQADFRFALDKDCLLLGNENHLVLLAENLLKNAQYFQARARDKRATIVMSLTKAAHQALLCVYNPGPHIDQAVDQKIYQLGFSTRDPSQRHGKGLGLYFVSQIVSGYEGRIEHHNCFNQPENYSIRIETQDGIAGRRIRTQVVEVGIVNGQPKCRLTTEAANDDESVSHQLAWQFPQAIKSVEITDKSRGQTASFDDIDPHQIIEQKEPSADRPPRWQITLSHQQGHGRLVFEPLDISGVEFRVWLPLAQPMEVTDQQIAEQQQVDDDYLAQLSDKYKPMG